MAYSEKDVRKISNVLFAAVAAIALVGVWMWRANDDLVAAGPLFIWALGLFVGVLFWRRRQMRKARGLSGAT